MFKARPKQQEVLNYTDGKMGVSAVPGSGKTHILSYLAAKLIKEYIRDEQEVLIVTLVNSAVDNFSSRISGFIKQYGLLPNMGYRVRTLHGLAHDIVRERPGLVGLADDFQIIDERISDEILHDVTDVWIKNNPFCLDDYIPDDTDELKRNWLYRERYPEFIISIARNFIKHAKEQEYSAEDLRNKIQNKIKEYPLIEMCLTIYEDYTKSLNYRGAVDFDDLIRLALKAVKTDKNYLSRLKYQWPYILEDEAQDSSRLQEEILRTLCGPSGNWVRVGDPNQAIYETFTNAKPKYLKEFIKEKGVIPKELPNSGRSTKSIIKLANYLITWTQNFHPSEQVKDALLLPYIEPAPQGDPQPNPVDNPGQVMVVSKKFSSQEELNYIINSLKSWLPKNQDKTVAVLTTINSRGYTLAQELKRNKIAHIELLQSTRNTRESVGAMVHILAYLSNPESSHKLSTVYEVWRRKGREDEEENRRIKNISKLIKNCKNVEDFIWPVPGKDWLTDTEDIEKYPHIYEELKDFRELVRRWQKTTLLPVDQLILTLGQDIFREPSELALTHKIAVMLGSLRGRHPFWRIPEFNYELMKIAKNERKFLGFSEEETGFDPEKYKGKVVISTMHKAKGLEWDRVYLLSVNNYDFPSGLPHDTYRSESLHIKNRLNLDAEIMGQFNSLLSGREDEYIEGEHTIKSRYEYIAERLRLLYVGITRAKRELIITWNNGKRNDLQPSTAFIALRTFLEGNYDKK